MSTRSIAFSQNHRAGFSILELLVVVAIIGLLIALLLPAVQSAREGGRRAKCLSNLRQLGVAFANYSDVEGSFPWGRVTTYDSRVAGPNRNCSSRHVDKSYLVQLLPYLEAGTLFDAFNHRLSAFAPENDTPRRFALSSFHCPADIGTPFEAPALSFRSFAAPPPSRWLISPTSYAGSFGAHPVLAMPAQFPDCKVPGRVMAQADGVLTDIMVIRERDVSDGLSKTMFVAERAFAVFREQTGPRPDEGLYHGWWFSGNLGDSLFVAYDAPNAYKKGRRGFADYCGSASMHDGGLHVLMGDGSAKFVSDSISSWPFDDAAGVPKGATRNADSSFTNLPPRGVWQALATRAGNDGGL